MAHLLILALRNNNLISTSDISAESQILWRVVYRYERLNYEYEKLCKALEKAKIPFIPLKGSILRDYYPEPWMRTSCDIDVLIHKKNLARAIAYLSQNLEYVEKERATHDVSLYSPQGNHIELHFDLVEEGRAKNAINVLNSVWENVSLHKDYLYRYDMDEFFYYYHIAHMAKHFESGGCGIRPFVDLWILDSIECADYKKRSDLLKKGELIQFSSM